MYIHFQLLKIVIIFSDVMNVYEGVSLNIADQLREIVYWVLDRHFSFRDRK